MIVPAAVRQDTAIDTKIDDEEDQQDEEDHCGDANDDDLSCGQESPEKFTGCNLMAS